MIPVTLVYVVNCFAFNNAFLNGAELRVLLDRRDAAGFGVLEDACLSDLWDFRSS